MFAASGQKCAGEHAALHDSRNPKTAIFTAQNFEKNEYK